ncbi:MAG: methylmalonyl-CoA epimerase [candidate division Zixibacteria bacterium SM23_73_3]|nr:MAG: methylmalonyl-CoA epimerase [candidate division Zixibacteria bacterium SM23_73_3]
MKLEKIEHIGIAVKEISEVSKFYKDIFECQISEEIDVPERKLRIAFTEISGVKLEFLMPTDSGSVVAKFIDKKGEGIHHICFEVEDVERAITELKEKGVELVDDKPRLGAEGKKIIFIKPKSTHGVLIELKEK